MSALDVKTASCLAAAAADMTARLADSVQALANALGTAHDELHDLAAGALELAGHARGAAQTIDQLARANDLADRPDGARSSAERDLVLALLQTLRVAFESSVEFYRQAARRLGDRAAVAQEHWLDSADLDRCES